MYWCLLIDGVGDRGQADSLIMLNCVPDWPVRFALCVIWSTLWQMRLEPHQRNRTNSHVKSYLRFLTAAF